MYLFVYNVNIFLQALSQQWELYNISFEYFDIFSMLCAIPYLPFEEFNAAQEIVQTAIDATNNAQLQNIMVFWRNILLPAGAKISFAKCDPGINDYASCFDKLCRVFFSLHPALWTFVGNDFCLNSRKDP